MYTYLSPTGTPGPLIANPFPASNTFFPGKPAFGDFNGDGFPDLATYIHLVGVVLIPGPAFNPATTLVIPTSTWTPIAAGDWVQDGFDDLFVAEGNFALGVPYGFRLLTGPLLLPTVFLPLPYAGTVQPVSASPPLDLNGDGLRDVVFGAMVPGGGWALPVYSPYTLLPVTSAWPHIFGLSGAAGAGTVGDFDADGFEDFASSMAVGNNPPVSGSAEIFKAKTLQPSATSVSLGTGGTVELRIRASAGHAGRTYLIVASASGTYPGVPVGKIRVPILPDAFTLVVAAGVNGPLFQNFAGTLDANGEATASLVVSSGVFADPLLHGVQVHFADVILNAPSTGVQVSSNPVTITLAP